MLFDTHSHFDFPVFDATRVQLAKQAYQQGVQKMLVAGFSAHAFSRLTHVKLALAAEQDVPEILLAAGLHPGFVEQHQESDLSQLVEFIATKEGVVALGEIGLDTYSQALKTTLSKQKHFFAAQLAMAEEHKLPVILHIRKAHADSLAILKAAKFTQGGIAHSFSGGIQEAKAFITHGFKLGITGQVCNPNAKKLRNVIQAVGSAHLVIETDCPDMLPYQLHQKNSTNINAPENLVYVFETLQQLLNEDETRLQHILWQNSHEALCIS